MFINDRYFGVIITDGPSPYQVIQQINGWGTVDISGFWNLENVNGTETIYARVKSEINGKTIIPYKKCLMLDNNMWQVKLDIPTGGPYIIETLINNEKGIVGKSLRGDMIKHICIGDVFVIAGGSNAVGFGEDPVEDEPALGVHYLDASGVWNIASHPLADSTNTEHPINREIKNPGHSPYIKTAKILKRELGYPIGLIPVAKSDSFISDWISEGKYFINMVTITDNISVKGVFWYQGETDANNSTDKYYESFARVVSDFREYFNDESLPFYTVEVNKELPFLPHKELQWQKLRDEQLKATQQLKNVFIVKSTDCDVYDESCFNTSESNILLGKRLAECVLKQGLFN